MPEVIFNGPDGRIEGRYQHSKTPYAPIALMLHPHPQHGGTMNNKVVYNLYHAFARRGFSVLRFNFRGVGRSQGEYDRGETRDLSLMRGLHWDGYRVCPSPRSYADFLVWTYVDAIKSDDLDGIYFDHGEVSHSCRNPNHDHFRMLPSGFSWPSTTPCCMAR